MRWSISKPDTVQGAPTIDLRVDYLLPARPENLLVESRVVRIGGRVSVVDSRAFHASAPDGTVATGKGVYNVLRLKKGA